MTARRQIAAASEPAPVAWRGGTHITGTAIWCDARRAREVCFVSCAHAVAASRHGQLIATAPTLALLARTDRRQQPHSALSVPYGRPFTLGTRRLELVQSGHSFGSASLSIEVDGRRVLYAGMVDPRGVDLGGAADLRECDAVVLTATYGEPHYRFPDPAEVRHQVFDFAAETAAAGGVPVLLVASPSKGLDLAAFVGDRLEIAAHRAIHHAAQRLRDQIPSLPRIRRASAGASRVPGGRVLLWLAARRAALAGVELPPNSRLALVSGAALDPAALAAAGADLGFPWSSQADYRDLRDYVDACGARRVYLTGRCAESFAAAIDRPDRRAEPLGPPRQMSLFP